MQFLKNIFAPIGAVLGFINKYFKSLIFLLILFLIFAGGESAQQKGANLAQLSLSGAIMDDSEILEKIETLKNDEAIKGVLLLIDSPGGALSPSVEISLAIKSLNSRKPVVAYAKGTMASGSYLGGVWASKIYANPGSFIGSIGVIMQGLDVSEAAAKLGFAEQIVKAGELKEAGTMMRKWSDAERASLQALVDESYELFTREVAQARSLDLRKRDAWANARVFLASGAKGIGLIDEVGSLEDAKSALIKASGVADPIWQEPSAYEKMMDKLANKSESLVRGAFGAKLMAY
ncbi:signal peptide peptidase SppA [uncultured Campylobacter sp.]|uniref:signal peptide peptidase SppA n=1 Tax=uncultured Campylobacter sp. TaxID=218934 RepID=UPI0026301BD0|nr:signal peptide peptidase SppA [uncultured Campylobacter sp.]